MKQYIYTLDELGLTSFSDGILRLNCEVTDDPNTADVFVCPEPLFKFTNHDDIPNRFRMMLTADRIRRHVFLDLSEHFTTYRDNTPIFIRAALTNKMLAYSPNSISWPWPVDNFGDCVFPDEQIPMHTVSFHGWGGNLARRVAAKSCSALKNSDVVVHPGFFGYQSTDFQTSRRLAYRNSMRQSLLCLTVESIPGVIPYRFYEAMSAGRTQLYIGSDYNLPFAEEIPYDKFVTKLPTDHADQAGEAALEWLVRCTKEQLIEKGLEARGYWQKYLWRDKWVDLMTYAVERKIRSWSAA